MYIATIYDTRESTKKREGDFGKKLTLCIYFEKQIYCIVTCFRLVTCFSFGRIFHGYRGINFEWKFPYTCMRGCANNRLEHPVPARILQRWFAAFVPLLAAGHQLAPSEIVVVNK